jgi:hypothetical protein
MELVNRVAESGIMVIDLEQFVPKDEDIQVFDLKDYLFKGLLLKEKEFRSQLAAIDWEFYSGKFVGVYCSSDALIPQWAYMLTVKYLLPVVQDIYFGDKDVVINQSVARGIERLAIDTFVDAKVVIKGCGKYQLLSSAYIDVSKKLLPVVQSLMFGEPCSTVPVYKKKK